MKHKVPDDGCPYCVPCPICNAYCECFCPCHPEETPMNAHDMLPSDSEPDACTCCTCSSCYRNPPCNSPSCIRCWPVPQHIIDPPTPFSITGPGEYKTRDGRKAVILDIYDERAFGRYQMKVNVDWKSCDWNLRGQRSRFQSNRDIITKWTEPRKPVEGWVNTNDSGAIGSYIYHSQLEAERSRGSYTKTVKVRECPDT